MTRRNLGWLAISLTLGVGCQTPHGGALKSPAHTAYDQGEPAPPGSPYGSIVRRPNDPASVSQVSSQTPAQSPIPKSSADEPNRFNKLFPPPEPVTAPEVPMPPPNPRPTPVPLESPKHPIVLALEYMLDNRPDEARRALQKYDARTQEFLLRLLPPLSLIKDQNLHPDHVVVIREQFFQLQKSLEQKGNFAISRLAFCESIRGFAIYNPMPAGHEFTAARPDLPGEMVQLYVELKNFESEPTNAAGNPAAGFETRFSSRVEIRDARGQVQWSHRFRPEDLKLVSRTRLSEHYHNYTFALPALPAGVYELCVETTDETQPNSRMARASLPLRIANK